MQISEPAEYALLGLLSTQPMHGYEMFQHFAQGTPGQIVHLEMSQMYAFLKKLERLDYIEATIETQGSRPPRKIFHLSESGRRALNHWLLEPVARPRDIRILFLIKLYFMRQLMPERMPLFFEQQIQTCEQFLERLRHRQQVKAYDASASDDQTFFASVVLSSRIYQTEAILTWLHEVQRTIGQI